MYIICGTKGCLNDDLCVLLSVANMKTVWLAATKLGKFLLHSARFQPSYANVYCVRAAAAKLSPSCYIKSPLIPGSQSLTTACTDHWIAGLAPVCRVVPIPLELFHWMKEGGSHSLPGSLIPSYEKKRRVVMFIGGKMPSLPSSLF